MRRKNKDKFKDVQRAIRLADKGFTQEASILCKVNNIPFDVALRVITKPKQRRNRTKVL